MASPRFGWALRAYLAASRLVPLLAPALLRRRLARGREDPARWREKLGEPGLPRPEGRLIWLHAVGLGEVLALRALIVALQAQDAGLSFLVTSSARSSAQVFAGNLPPRTQHQYLPLDAPAYLARFLAHWRPDLSVWAEQDIWPGAIAACVRQAVPLALVNARMDAASFEKRKRARGLYADLYSRFALVAAQDTASARHLGALGAVSVAVTGTLKAAAPVLSARPDDLAQMRAAFAGRRVWVAASTHPEDEVVALRAQDGLAARDPRWLLVLVPRDPGRAAEIPGLRRSLAMLPGPEDSVYLADTFGELGLWYRLADAALIGGSFGPVQGHNPWEAVALGCPVLHGPNVAHFAADYAALGQAGAAVQVGPDDLAGALAANTADAAAGLALVERARAALHPLAARLRGLIGGA